MPALQSGDRQMRTSMLGEALTQRGHEVIWWNSTMNHRRKQKYFDRDTDIRCNSQFLIRLLNGPLYTRNISIRRYLNHLVVALRFLVRAHAETQPDIIFCSFPTPELAAAAVYYGRRKGVPVVVDIRDLWPDELYGQLPKGVVRLAARMLAIPMTLLARYATRSCLSITAISPSYLSWAHQRAGRSPGQNDRIFYFGYPCMTTPNDQLRAATAQLIRQGVNPQKKIFAFVGTFAQGIDIEAIVAAARELQTRNRNDIQVVIAGEGERKDWVVRNCQDLANAAYVGWQSRAGIEALLRLAWAGLGPYRAHSRVSLGNKIFEYASGGLPVLISLAGDARDLVETYDFGCFVRPEDGSAWATSMERYVDEPDMRNRQSSNARRFFSEKCDAERIYSDLSAFLEGLASTPNLRQSIHLEA